MEKNSSSARTFSLERTPSSASSNSELIDEPVGDVFFDAVKKYVIKKLELEVLKEQLDSAEYQKAYPQSDNIYYKLHGETLSIDSLDEVEEVEDTVVISNKITEKEGEISELKYEYEKKTGFNGSHSQLILFVDTLDNYIKNKEDLRTIIKNINTIVQTAIPLSVKLGEIVAIGWNTTQTEREQKNKLKAEWVSNFRNYQNKIKEIRKLFHKIYEHDIHKKSLLVENDNLYIKLSSPKLFNTDGLFYKATYDSEEIISLFKSLYNNVFFDILKDYDMYNDFVQIKINPGLSRVPGKKSIFVLKKENDELRAMVSRLEFKLSQLESSDLPKSGKRIQELRRISNLTQEEKKRLNEKMESKIKELKTKHQADVDELNKEIEQLRSRNTQTTSTQSIDIDVKSTEAQYIEELNKNTEVLTEQLAKKIAELTDAKNLLDTPKEKIETELTLLESQEAPNGFLKLVIESADLYEKDGFQKRFEELLNYQPKDKFMFKYVFNEIETNKTNYEYLEEFLKNQVKIPKQIEKDHLFPQIMGSLTFKPVPQTHL